MPTYTMFKRDGTPLRATAAAAGWEFEVTELPPGSGVRPGRTVVHEITHTHQNRSAHQNHVYQNNQSNLEFLVSRAGRQPSASGRYFIPEVDDEVIVMFSSGNGVYGAVDLAPKGSRGGYLFGFGRVNRATFALLIKRKGRNPLGLNILTAHDEKLERNVRCVTVF